MLCGTRALHLNVIVPQHMYIMHLTLPSKPVSNKPKPTDTPAHERVGGTRRLPFFNSYLWVGTKQKTHDMSNRQHIRDGVCAVLGVNLVRTIVKLVVQGISCCAPPA